MSDRTVGQPDRTFARYPVAGGSSFAQYTRINGAAVEYLQADDSFSTTFHEFALSLVPGGFERFFVWPSSTGGWTVKEQARHSVYGLSESVEHNVTTAGGDGFTQADRDAIAAIRAKTDLLGVGMNVTVVSPVSGGATISIVSGDDYYAADGRALDFLNGDGDWPNLTAAAVRLSIRRSSMNDPTVIVTGTVVVPTGAGQKLRFELSKTDTRKLVGDGGAGSAHVFAIEARLAGGGLHRVTLVLGTAYVLRDSPTS